MTIFSLQRYKQPAYLGILSVAASAILYGCLGFFGSQLLKQHFSVANMLFWRFLIASLWMLMWSVCVDKQGLGLPKLSLNQWLVMGLVCLSYSLGSFFYFLASQAVGTGIAMVIFFSYPLFIVFLSWVSKAWEWNNYHILMLVILVAGLILLQGKGGHALTFMGLSFALLAAMAYAAYIFSYRYQKNAFSSVMLTFVVCLGSALLFLGVALYEHSLHIPLTLSAWGYTLALGILATALPIQLLLIGLQYTCAIKASLLSVLEPVITVGLGMMLLHESVSPSQGVGIVLVLGAALLMQFDRLPLMKIKK